MLCLFFFFASFGLEDLIIATFKANYAVGNYSDAILMCKLFQSGVKHQNVSIKHYKRNCSGYSSKVKDIIHPSIHPFILVYQHERQKLPLETNTHAHTQSEAQRHTNDGLTFVAER